VAETLWLVATGLGIVADAGGLLVTLLVQRPTLQKLTLEIRELEARLEAQQERRRREASARVATAEVGRYGPPDIQWFFSAPVLVPTKRLASPPSSRATAWLLVTAVGVMAVVALVASLTPLRGGAAAPVESTRRIGLDVALACLLAVTTWVGVTARANAQQARGLRLERAFLRERLAEIDANEPASR
jgi:hypothetical protein